MNEVTKKIISIAVLLICIGLIGFFAVFLSNQYESLTGVERQINSLRRDIYEQEAVAESLRRELASFGTAEYFERIARERLGMIHRNNIQFRFR